MTDWNDLVQAYLDAAHACDVASLAPHVTDDFTIEYLPASLGGAGNQPAGFDGWAKAAQTLKATLEGGVLNTDVLEKIYANDKIVLHIRNVDTKTVTGKPFTNEYIVIITTATEGGTLKIKHIKEFVDSSFMQSLYFGQQQ